MLSAQTYKFKQTDEVNFASEEYGKYCGSLVGKMCRMMVNTQTKVEDLKFVRLYLIDETGHAAYGPILGLGLEDLEAV